MDLDEALRCLAEADADRRRPELCTGRYLTVAYSGGIELDTTGTGVTASVYDALDQLAEYIEEAAEGTAEELLDRLDDTGPDQDDGPPLADIRTPRRRLLALVLTGEGGPMDIVTERFEEDVYLGSAMAELPGSRFVLLASAAPPHQDFALGVLELERSATN